MQLTSNCPTSAIISVLLDVYPAEAGEIKNALLPSLTSTFAGYPGTSTLTIQHPRQLGQEAEEKLVWPSSCYYVFKEMWT